MTLLDKISSFLGKVSRPIARGLNWIAAFFLAAMMVLTGVDVSMRYFLNHPITGSYEITEYMMSIVVGFGLAYCAMEKGHVQVDLITLLLPQRFQNALKIVADFFMTVVYGLITWQAWVRARELMATQQHSEVLYLPIFPFVWIVCLGCAVFSLVALQSLLDHLREAIKS